MLLHRLNIHPELTFIDTFDVSYNECLWLKYVSIWIYQTKNPLSFLCNLQTAIKSSGEISAAGKIKYLHNLSNGEVLREFETIPWYIIHTTNANFNQIVLVIRVYFFSINTLSKQKSTMCRGMNKSRALKVLSDTD